MSALSDLARVDPMLGELAYNGNGTLSFLPLPGSPAIDLNPNSCQPRDQRGFGRPRDGDGNGTAVCDAGSCERDPNHLLMDGFETGTTVAWN